jgi:magnesium transporter
MPNRKRRFQRKTKPGAPPGTVVTQNDHATLIHVIGYSPSIVKELDCASFADFRDFAEHYDVVWVNVIGLGNVDLLQEFARLFRIHNLTLEDVVNVHQRAKSEVFDNYHYIVTRMVSNPGNFASEQLSIFQTGKFVFTFQEKKATALNR